ncbi:hypothetical protein GCM10025881_28530 [Pseudolysinimonas kribbensis]|uniref:Uncharacterized protein n=1 Tax=Pseudolysinimonas kribbensis TaxID=433641 RepID=A0ABQ6K6M8_9MICO|nr:hypothetical protein GCM10025881_28530 [Pseudolysinimonas kribbensis]
MGGHGGRDLCLGADLLDPWTDAAPEAALQHPAISDILDPALDQLWFRTLFVAAWIALGLALVTRGRRD